MSKAPKANIITRIGEGLSAPLMLRSRAGQNTEAIKIQLLIFRRQFERAGSKRGDTVQLPLMSEPLELPPPKTSHSLLDKPESEEAADWSGLILAND